MRWNVAALKRNNISGGSKYEYQQDKHETYKYDFEVWDDVVNG